MNRGYAAAISALMGILSAVGSTAAGDAPYNILVVIADDLGVDMLSGYDESCSAPCSLQCGGDCRMPCSYPATPTIDGLGQQGLRFRNAWAMPSGFGCTA